MLQLLAQSYNPDPYLAVGKYILILRVGDEGG